MGADVSEKCVQRRGESTDMRAGYLSVALCKGVSALSDGGKKERRPTFCFLRWHSPHE